MGIAKGGKIEQVIRTDPYPPSQWNSEHTMAFNVQLLNSNAFQQVTGLPPPETPVTAMCYAKQGLPFFDMYEEQSDISGDFDKVKSVRQIDKKEDTAVEPRLLSIDPTGRRPTAAYENLKTIVNDPDGLLDPVGPLREFRTVFDLQKDVERMSLTNF